MKPVKETNKQEISRKEALKKLGNYGKYAALTAIGTYTLLSPKKAQAASPEDPGTGFGGQDIKIDQQDQDENTFEGIGNMYD